MTADSNYLKIQDCRRAVVEWFVPSHMYAQSNYLGFDFFSLLNNLALPAITFSRDFDCGRLIVKFPFVIIIIIIIIIHCFAFAIVSFNFVFQNNLSIF